MELELSQLGSCEFYPPAENSTIRDAEKWMNTTFPKALKQLWKKSDGLYTDEGVLIYGAEQIAERNQTWETDLYAEGYVAIGDDSGGRVLIMLAEAGAKDVWIVDGGSMSPDDGMHVTDHFIRWVNQGLELGESEEDEYIDDDEDID